MPAATQPKMVLHFAYFVNLMAPHVVAHARAAIQNLTDGILTDGRSKGQVTLHFQRVLTQFPMPTPCTRWIRSTTCLRRTLWGQTHLLGQNLMELLFNRGALTQQQGVP